MKALKQIMTNPVAVAVVFVYWVVASYAIWGEEHYFVHEPPLLTIILYYLDFPALIVTTVIWLPFRLILGDNLLIFYLGLFLNLIILSFQWLIIGNLLSEIINSVKPEEGRLSLLNE